MELKRQKEVYVIGHKNPDSDSICSAIAYASLKNEILDRVKKGDSEGVYQNLFVEGGNVVYVPARAGQVNTETEYVLKTFNQKTPVLMNAIRTQVGDINIRHIKGIPAKEYLLSTLELTSKENIDITIYSNETFSNKNICGVKVMASKDAYTLVTRNLAILLELIHCESIIEEDYEVAWAYKIYELAKSYKDSNFSKHHMFYPRKVYIRLANLLESMHISNRVMEIYESKKKL